MATGKLHIKDLSEDDRPRERMMRYGAGQLSDAQLLAILIGSGNHDETAVELQRVMDACDGDLSRLAKWTLTDFARYKGMGPAKSLTIMAALELGKRRQAATPSARPTIRSSTDSYNLLYPILCDLPTEEVWVLLLNHACRLIDKVRLAGGGIDATTVDIRTVLREAIVRNATAIVLAHNHPSGNTRPSEEDRRLTKTLSDAAKLMHISLLDHVIIADGSYYSFADDGAL